MSNFLVGLIDSANLGGYSCIRCDLYQLRKKIKKAWKTLKNIDVTFKDGTHLTANNAVRKLIRTNSGRLSVVCLGWQKDPAIDPWGWHLCTIGCDIATGNIWCTGTDVIGTQYLKLKKKKKKIK